MASVFPLAWITGRIAPGAEVVHLGQRGVDPHDLELTPGEAQALTTADVVVYLGPVGFQPQVEQAVDDSSGQVVSVVEAVDGDRLLPASDADGGAPDDLAVDPHVWFDPTLMAEAASAVGDAFASAEPGDADAFRVRAAEVRDELLALGDELDDTLGDCEQDEALVSHEAYAYLLRPRGLDQLGIAGNEPEAGASPARLAELVEEVERRGIRAVLAEPVEGRADAEALAREAGVELLEIDPLEVVSPADYERGYPSLLREQAERFARALDCR